MPTATSTTPSTPRLSEVARHLVIPDGIATSNFPRVYRRLQEVGVSFDPWQVGFGTVALGCRADGQYACTIGGVSASIPRQVGKTYTVGNLLIGMCLEFDGLRVVWTSHHNRTTTNTFRSMQGMVRRKGIAKHLAPNGIRTANGEQEIRFSNGSIIMFGAREHGFGRGMDAVDVLVFDEAQILGIKALEDMVPATNQARHPHGALVFFIGTPPRPIDDGSAFTSKRRRALTGDAKDMLYVELSADRDATLDDLEQVAKANPSFPHRTPLESILRMRENIPDEASQRREMLGIWDDAADLVARVIQVDEWAATGITEPPVEGIKSLGVKFSPDGSRVSVSGALKHEAGIHVELVGAHSGSMASGTASLVAWVAERSKNYAAIVVDGKSHAGAFVNALIDAGVSKRAIVTPTWPEVATANAMLLDAVILRQVTHLASEGQQQLDNSATGTTKKVRGTEGAWSFVPIGDADETPIASAALAHWGAKTSKRVPGRKQTGMVM